LGVTHTPDPTCAARSPGYWQTHRDHTLAVFNTLSYSEKNVCGKQIPGINEYMGGFWDSPAKTSTGAARSQSDKTQINASFQILAAVLNHKAFGNNAYGTSIADANAACASFNTGSPNSSGLTTALNTIGQVLAAGETVPTTVVGGTCTAQAGKIGVCTTLSGIALWDTI